MRFCITPIVVASMAMILGVGIAVIAVWCAVLEEQRWPHLQGEILRISGMIFDAYRALSLLGAATVCVGAVDLLAPDVTHEAFPSGISWSLKVSALFFLALRLHAHKYPRGARSKGRLNLAG